ncbi:MAG: AAA domain-containing protein [Candidatus Thalassarchaeaceae archaeon]|nr:AAA domain-containing protein [Candidatus Thalassarchaeaceae archaeon]MDP7043932.1 AAA domain-containing protein [Candidatus Thalassarchaeaceae archaeon]
MADEKRGEVRRLKPNPNSASSRKDSDEPTIRFIRAQDFHNRYSRLIKWELEDEMAQVDERLRSWSKQKLLAHGYALLELQARNSGWLFGERVVKFHAGKGKSLGSHRFSHGDIITICRTDPVKEIPIEGIVLMRKRNSISVVVSENLDKIRSGTWRIDRGANRVAHDRMQDALREILRDEPPTPLADLLLGRPRDVNESAESRPQFRGIKSREVFAPADLNESQTTAFYAAMNNRLSLIQGPPGTGKTHTAVRILKGWTEQGTGPILAAADSNVAVDNLLEGLLKLGIKAVRVGQPVKVRAQLRGATVRARIEEHPLQEEVRELIGLQENLQRRLPALKGKEKGLAHRDLKMGWKDIRSLEEAMAEDVLNSAEVVCSTCIGAGHMILGNKKFSNILIDEATQAIEPATWVPIMRSCRRLVLVGDHRQLPPTVISRRAEDDGLRLSMFERLVEIGLHPHMLNIQYRMHPVISEYSSARYYDNQLENGVTAQERPAPAGFLWPDWDAPVAFVPVDGAEELAVDGKSRLNRDEAGWVVRIIEGLLEPGDLQPSDIGVVSPYNGQVRLLTDLLDGRGILAGENSDESEGLEIRSIDGYQGREKEVIVLSTVRANDNGEVGFLSDRRRLNVALTRPKRGLIVVGSPNTLRHDGDWDGWLEWVRERKLEAWHVLQSG